ncbi:hypothetical protein D1007_07048 [Hordeum vulgare]|nr:hypothetical protein D1007_07048 [Hordeum vulgare]
MRRAPAVPAEPGSMVLRPELYGWDGMVHEWVSVPPVWLDAMPEQEAAYLEHSRQQRRASGDDVVAAWETTFPWAGPTSSLVDLTSPKGDDEEDTQGSVPPCI